MPAAQQLAQDPERPDDLLRGGAQPADVRRDQRPPLRDLARQQRHPLARRQRRVRLVHAQRREHLGDRLAVAGRVLAHIQAGEVEAEHLDLPDRVVQLGHRDELAVPVAQQALCQPQVGEQLARGGVALGGIHARRAHARGEQREVAAVGLLGVTGERACGLLGEQLGQRRQRARELVRAADEPVAQRHPLREQLDPRLEQVQAAAPHHVERLRGHRGGDVRVAVAVAAHPGAERQQRRHRDLLAREALLDRGLELAVELGHHAVQRRGEVDEPGVDLVARGGGGGAHLVGAPQLLDRAGDRPPRLRLVGRHRRALVEIAQAREDARELLDGRAPPRLGRVGGHDEPQLGAREHVAQLGGGRAALGKVLDRGAQRAGPRRVAEPVLAPAEPPHPLVVLGEVDELEPARERPHQHLGVVQPEPRDQLLELLGRGRRARARALAERSGALVQGDRVLALARGQDRGEELQQERVIVDERAPAEVAQRRGARLRGHAQESRRRAAPRIGPAAKICDS